MVFFFAGVSLLSVIALLYLIYRTKRESRRREDKDAAEIASLRRTVEQMKARHLTANGGLSRDVKDQLLDILAKIDAIGDPLDELSTRHEDLRREVIKMMNRKKEMK